MMHLNFPKVELHLHIDCSLSFDFVRKYIPGISLSDYKKRFNAPVNCCSLKDYLLCAQEAIDLMQSKEQVFDSVLDVIDQLEKDHVLYAELRFAPLQHLKQGLSPEQVVETTIEALKHYKGTVKIGLLLCTLRHFTKEQSDLTADLVIKYADQGVVGLDLAADEAGYGLENHEGAFQKVLSKGLSCTSHAGEALGPSSVWETLQKLKVQRIGHGIRSVEDPTLLNHLKENDIHLEICPTSNELTEVYPKGTPYPLPALMGSDVSFGINTDGRAISNVSLNSEYAMLSETFKWTALDFYRANVSAMKASFAPQEVKNEVLEKLHAYYEPITGSLD